MNEQPDPNEKIREQYRKNFASLIMLAPHLFDDKELGQDTNDQSTQRPENDVRRTPLD
jgi:hypothetical protein